MKMTLGFLAIVGGYYGFALSLPVEVRFSSSFQTAVHVGGLALFLGIALIVMGCKKATA